MSTNNANTGVVILGIGEHHTGSEVMASIGLGTCVCLIIHDKERDIGSLAHVMLPSSEGKKGEYSGKFADTAVDLLIGELKKLGSKETDLVAKLIGGASMFENFSGNLNIGDRNTAVLKEMLAARKIPVIKQDLGGNVGRTVTYYPAENGRVLVKQADGVVREM
jgi:chemotaxis protein CheD